MGAIIGNGQFALFTSNAELETVILDALEVVEGKELSPEEKGFVETMRQVAGGLFPGFCPQLERLFPTLEERAFWGDIWDEVAVAVLSGKLTDRFIEPTRRIMVACWCAQNVRYARTRDEVALARAKAESVMENEAAREQGVQTLVELEAKRELEEADQRGIVPSSISSSGRVRCPYCREVFDTADASAWNGDRHLPCLTRLSLR